jgi:2-keto-4-pentenoate hydratase
MRLTPYQHQAIAARLAGAYTGGALDPVTVDHPDATVADGYAIQQVQVDGWLAAGRRLVGRKVGLTSLAMQRQLGVEQPDSGVLLADDCFADGDEIPMARFLQPRVEPEIAFVLGRDLSGPGLTVLDAQRAVEFVLPALEIIDSRIKDWRIGIVDTVADNASCGALVLGARPTPLRRQDLRLTGCVFTVDGRVAATGAGGAVLGSPILALVWLANSLGERGLGLRAGQVILPGSVTAAQPVRPGQAWRATFAGLGAVAARFSGDAP